MSSSLADPVTTQRRDAPARRGDGGPGAEDPICAELFSLEHLEAHARSLAREAIVVTTGSVRFAGESLRRRFAANGRQLARAREAIVAASARREPLTPDAEWLLDNYHIIDDTLREVRQDLPRSYYKELPKLTSGSFRGLPRVYALGVELVAHTDSSLDETNLTHFVHAYQMVTPLTIGELWAVPIMLRIVLVENLRRLSGQMLHTRAERQKAEAVLANFSEHVRRGTGQPTKLTWSDPCIVRLLQALRDKGQEAADHVEWLENCLACSGADRVELVRRENGRQAANQVSVGNCVTSLRLLSNLDWAVFFEKTSVVESLLCDDPARVYARQDFGTKDRYRRAVEQLARRSHRDEASVAHRALELSRSTGANGDDAAVRPSGHVGYYLLGPGRPAMEQALGYRPSIRERLHRATLNYPEAVYFSALIAGTALALVALLSLSAGNGWMASIVVLAALLPATEIAIGVVHHLITRLLPPRVLAKLDFKEGIPGDCATFVVMPTLLTGVDDATSLADRLEVHYLSNPDPQLRFALLTDFADAPEAHMPEDEKLVAAALDRIRTLNRRYAARGPDRFFLFHRGRGWNPVQGRWMGYERKRGKLGEFNRLLRGATDTSYSDVSSSLSDLPVIQFVITLDADTQLPRESAARLVAILAHPLNRPVFDPSRRRVVDGYGVLQPRVSLSLLAGTRSLFARIMASSAGIDPYTTAVSDVYQDLFGRGTFTGKGIYALDAFEAATGHTFPENRILSHDLIEGNYARCGLVTDIELLDDFPSRYNAYARREHRWVRGDWQIARWVLPTVPVPLASEATGVSSADGNGFEPPPGVTVRPSMLGEARNPLPALERWKVLDNLRRSLVPPALVCLLAAGWTVLPGSPWLWSGVALLTLAMPLVLETVNAILNLLRGGSWRLQLRDVRGSLVSTGGQVLLSATFLASQAYQMVDAIARTLRRLWVSHRQLLEWETASAAEHRLGTGLLHFSVSMAAAPIGAIVLGTLTALVRPGALPAALPWLLIWLCSPLVAWYVSLPRVAPELPLDDEERQELRRIARKTWHFFDNFVTARDHWLPPDNFQEIPKGEVAHRTSPTNVGLYLLSSLAANDFGYLPLGSLADRLERAFDSLDRLERFHGHFHNWYDTRTLTVLTPPYVSTVDSGNLLGCLLTLKHGLRAKAERPFDLATVYAGLADTWRLANEALRAIEPPRSGTPEVMTSLQVVLDDLVSLLRQVPTDLLTARASLLRVKEKTSELHAILPALKAAIAEVPDELIDWARRLASEAAGWCAELSSLAPWLESLWPDEPPEVPAPNGSDSDPVAGRRRDIRRLLMDVAGLADLPGICTRALTELQNLRSLPLTREDETRVDTLIGAIGRSAGPTLRARLEKLAGRADVLAAAMDFKFLYNEQRLLFSVGFNRSAGRLDQSHYDLLASESALTSFLAVARGDVPKKHWFHLSRQLTKAPGGEVALLSWGGTMFEYLMPRLLWRNYRGTLLDESSHGAVARQIEFGRQMRVPWGVSESGFAALDAALDYQYQSFGVPGLGLKRGLSRDLVIAPYATALALMVRPHPACANLRALASDRAEGLYGFYEAVDYTRDRLRKSRRSAVVRSYMAHHQGMSLIALVNCLLDCPMVRRFHAEPMVRATELLLQERVPRMAPVIELHEDEVEAARVVEDGVLPMSRRITTPDTPHPRTHLLSNGQYTVMLTSAGSGFSRWRDLDVTRWREDPTADAWGQWIYVRDLRSGMVWSAGHQPVGRPSETYEAIFSTDKVELRRRDAGIETHMEITVSPEHAAEVRRLTITNQNLRFHDFEVTSYAEIVLAPHRADVDHPAFGKLFLETEWVASADALLCRRRPRAADEKPVWGIHVIAADGPGISPTQYETDRARFRGRGRGPVRPAALDSPLSGTTGAVLDPVLSLRRRIRVAPGSSVTISFTTAVATSRAEALALADQYHDVHGVTRAFELAWAHSQVQLRHLKLSAEQAHLYQRLAAYVLYAGSELRAPAAVVSSNHQGQSGLWRHGISGDKPIVLVQVADTEELTLARQILLAHAYWRLHGLQVDLVVLNEHPTAYQDETTQQLQLLVRTSDSHALADRPGGVFVRRSDQISDEDRALLQAAARVVLVGSRGSLAVQVDGRQPSPTYPAPLETTAAPFTPRLPSMEVRPPETLQFFNGLGGFTSDGREYAIALAAPGRDASQRTLPPAPWINVVANDRAGFLVSETGAGYTWVGNSQTNRLTPWSNDPVDDPPGEVVYLRDESTGQVWTPTPLPLGTGNTVVLHGQGYTSFASSGNGLSTELTLFVAPDDPVKFYRLRIRSADTRSRRLSITCYAAWVLGQNRDPAPMHIATERDESRGTILARNVFNADFSGSVAFADVSLRPCSATGDRTEFLGRNGSVWAPAALKRVQLAGRFGTEFDPCAALSAPFELKPGESKEIVFILGQAASADEALRLAAMYRDPSAAAAALNEVRRRWDEVLTAVQVKTPDPAFDLLLNRWLLYQVLSCRVRGRSAFYQSGGAYGFRDQLQDVMALVWSAPGETKAQILRAAARQFVEGDVLHWWHPPAGRGVRTRISDDFLWLPLVVSKYIEVTGDGDILNASVPFIKAAELRPDQDEDCGLPQAAEESAKIYEHCARAIENGLRYGPHGLPLMGTGDWNDGMNRVGPRRIVSADGGEVTYAWDGKGESVWDAWLQLSILPGWADLAEQHGEPDRAKRWREEAARLRIAIEASAWDGAWYRRAYFDDGSPLGSAQNDECQIDSIAQTWAVICGAADPEHAARAMQSVYDRLVKREDGLILLLAPPFDKGSLHPGYIKGYVSGIRENGGQYTHGAVWVVLAAALQGEGTRAGELFALLNPINHGATPAAVAKYKVEPYVMAGDVYGSSQQAGRGGWTWYTGSAGWLYRVGLETILGFHRHADRLQLEPCIPKTWKGFELTFKYGAATYRVVVDNPNGVERGVQAVLVDGKQAELEGIALLDDGKLHEVRLTMG
jgi:cyclic beta-1,2-glucan synthetase